MAHVPAARMFHKTDVEGMILTGASSVLINGLAAARKDDPILCPIHASGGKILSGAEMVLIEGKPAARKGEGCECSGMGAAVSNGIGTVTIGERTLDTPFGSVPLDASGRFQITAPDGTRISGQLDADFLNNHGEMGEGEMSGSFSAAQLQGDFKVSSPLLGTVGISSGAISFQNFNGSAALGDVEGSYSYIHAESGALTFAAPDGTSMSTTLGEGWSADIGGASYHRGIVGVDAGMSALTLSHTYTLMDLGDKEVQATERLSWVGLGGGGWIGTSSAGFDLPTSEVANLANIAFPAGPWSLLVPDIGGELDLVDSDPPLGSGNGGGSWGPSSPAAEFLSGGMHIVDEGSPDVLIG